MALSLTTPQERGFVTTPACQTGGWRIPEQPEQSTKLVEQPQRVLLLIHQEPIESVGQLIIVVMIWLQKIY